MNERQHATKGTALIYAAWRGNLVCCKLLLQAGAYLNARTEWGSTALMFAAEIGHVQCVNLFIEKGAKVNIRNNYGETALMYAAVCGRSFLSAQILLKASAKINICDVFGQNALENHLVENSFVNRQLALLLAAGEKPKGHRIYKYDTCGKAIATLLIPCFLLEDHLQICLMHQCRKVIRKTLIEISPNEHLFNRVKLIGLPSILTNYLLYDISIDADNDNNEKNEYYHKNITRLPPGIPIYVNTTTAGFDGEGEDYSDDDYYKEDRTVSFRDNHFMNDSEEEEEEPESEVKGQGEGEFNHSTEDEKEDNQGNLEEKYVYEKEETGKENAEFKENKEAGNELEKENMSKRNEIYAEKQQEPEYQEDEFIAEWIKQDCDSRKSEREAKHGMEEQEENVDKFFDKNDQEQHQTRQIQITNKIGKQVKGNEVHCGNIWDEEQDEHMEKIPMSKPMDENREYWNRDQGKANEIQEWKHKEEVKDEDRENGANMEIPIEGSAKLENSDNHDEEEKEEVLNFRIEKEDEQAEPGEADSRVTDGARTN